MFQQNFIDRAAELKLLEEEFKAKASLIVIYGRRRVGKTELVNKFISNKPNIYFLADERSDMGNLKEMQGIMADYINEPLFSKAAITSWTELFDEFMQRVKGKTVIVIDEFPYLIRGNKAIPSIFQKIWDLNLAKKEIFLVILGSSISMMEKHALDYKSPLYGRRTAQLKILPLKFRHLKEFFPKKEMQELIKIYAVTDGIPLYIRKLDAELSFMDNLRQNVFHVGKFLYGEAEVLLKEELREVAKYFNILRAIADRRCKFNDIVLDTGLDKTLISKYLQNLLEMHIIKKEFPVTENKETRNARYIFSDNYYNFWFRFIYPYKTLIEGEKHDELLNVINSKLNIYFSFIFEKICKESLEHVKLPFIPIKLGRWWHKDKEIDIIALNEQAKEIMFVECKWKDNINAEKILAELKEKSKFVQWQNEKRKEHYCIMAKSFKKKLDKKECLCFDLKDLERML